MKTKGLKIINRTNKKSKLSYIAQKLLETANLINKYNIKSQNTFCYFSYKQPSETVPCIGNWDKFDHFIAVPRKFYMSIAEFKEKEARRKYYKNKINF